MQRRKKIHWVKPLIAVKIVLGPFAPSISAKFALIADELVNFLQYFDSFLSTYLWYLGICL